MKNNNRPIGIFDSGFGGLTVMSAINKMLPKESLIYFGDTAHVPYGSKSADTVILFSKNIASFLTGKGIKLLVIACNTASAFALPALQKLLPIPVIGVIEPGARAALDITKNKKIGVIGTEGTIKSNSYQKAINKISKSKVFEQACPLFVPLVEEGWNKTKVAGDIAKEYLKTLTNKNIDTLVLGCTHYPLLKDVLQKNVGKNIKLIDSAHATAKDVKDVLEKKKLSADKTNKPTLSFYVSDNPKKFEEIGSKFFAKKIKNVKKIILE